MEEQMRSVYIWEWFFLCMLKWNCRMSNLRVFSHRYCGILTNLLLIFLCTRFYCRWVWKKKGMQCARTCVCTVPVIMPWSWQVRCMQAFFFIPGPPNLLMSLQLLHFPQSSALHPVHLPHRRLRLVPVVVCYLCHITLYTPNKPDFSVVLGWVLTGFESLFPTCVWDTFAGELLFWVVRCACSSLYMPCYKWLTGGTICSWVSKCSFSSCVACLK